VTSNLPIGRKAPIVELYHLRAPHCRSKRTTQVGNPAHRTLDAQVRKKVGVLNRKIGQFGAMNLEGEIEPAKVEAFEQRKSELLEAITLLQTEVK
jgi:hypothetical protein